MRSSMGGWVENRFVNQLCAFWPRKGLAIYKWEVVVLAVDNGFGSEEILRKALAKPSG